MIIPVMITFFMSSRQMLRSRKRFWACCVIAMFESLHRLRYMLISKMSNSFQCKLVTVGKTHLYIDYNKNSSIA